MPPSFLRRVVDAQLAKAYRLGLPVPASRIVRMFNLNSRLVYRYLGELVAEGLVERVGRGLYRVRGSGRAERWVDYVLEAEWRVEPLYARFFAETVPEVYYYVADPGAYFQEWLGYPERLLVIVDEAVKGRVGVPGGYRVVYASMRGRRWRFSRDYGVSMAEPEQALADVLSYDPDYPVELDVLWNLDRIDLDEVARRCTPEGLRRLSTILAFYRVATGKPLATGFSYVALADLDLLRRKLSELVSYVFVDGEDVRRGI